MNETKITDDLYFPLTLEGGGGPSIAVEPLSVTENGTYTAQSGKAYSPVTVEVEQPAPVEDKPINFIEYDGTIIQSLTYSEAAALTEMPEIPEKEGFTNQGWWKSLATVKSATTPTFIYPHRVTTDGKTKIVIDLPETRLKPRLNLFLKGEISLDWGDGTVETITKTSRANIAAEHDYAQGGEYTIEITPAEGAELDYNGITYQYGYFFVNQGTTNTSNAQGLAYENAVKSLAFGTNWGTVLGIATQGYNGMFGLSYDNMTIENIPQEIGRVLFEKGEVVTFGSEKSSIGNNDENNNTRLKFLDLTSVTAIGIGAFQSDINLHNFTIPDSVTSIGVSAFNGCTSLTDIVWPSGLTVIKEQAFQNCSKLKSAVLPTGLTTIETRAFQGCTSLVGITLPSGLTSIGASAFNGCTSLTDIVCPSGLTSIGASAFYNCMWCNFDCTNLTVTGGEVDTALLNNQAFPSTNELVLLFADEATMNIYAQATNWSSYASKMTYVGA